MAAQNGRVFLKHRTIGMKDWRESIGNQTHNQDGSQSFQGKEGLLAVGVLAGFVTKEALWKDLKENDVVPSVSKEQQRVGVNKVGFFLSFFPLFISSQ